MSSDSTDSQATRRFLRRAASGTSVALALLGFAEGAARLAMGPLPPNPAVVPVSSAHLAEHQGRLQLVHPDNPAQDRSFPMRKRHPRVAVIGGSSVHHDVRQGAEVNFPTWLQRAQPAIEVLNLGAPGLTSEGVLSLVRDVRRLPADHLDLVVVYTGHNDFSEPLFRGGLGQPSRAMRRVHGFLGGSRLYRSLRAPTVALMARTRADPNALIFTRDGRASAWRQPALSRLEANLRSVVEESPAPVILSTLVRSFHAPPVGVLLPDGRPRCADTVRGLPRAELREPALYADRVNAQCGPGHALEEWYRAHAAVREGRTAAAQAHFAAMRRLDPLPLSAPPEADGVVERVAAETSAVVWRPQQALGVLPSGSHFDDLLHPSAAGARRLGDDLANLVVAQLDARGVRPPTAVPEDQTTAEDLDPPRVRSR